MPSLADVFRTLHEMQSEGVIGEYAIGGAMAALFYAEVTRTYDIDVFAAIPVQRGSIVALTDLYGWARKRGFEAHAEHLLIHGVPVQFLAANEGLEKEAVAQARDHHYQGVAVRVMRPEHLVALYTRAGGSGRRERAALLISAGVVPEEELHALLKRYNLFDKWQEMRGDDARG